MSNFIPVAPANLTATSLNRATKAECEFWITELNNAAGQKLIKKTGRAEELKNRLAEIYKIDRMAPAPEPVVGPLTVDQRIMDMQWADWDKLGDEWQETTEAGKRFLLCPPSEGTRAILLSILTFTDQLFLKQVLWTQYLRHSCNRSQAC